MPVFVRGRGKRTLFRSPAWFLMSQTLKSKVSYPHRLIRDYLRLLPKKLRYKGRSRSGG